MLVSAVSFFNISGFANTFGANFATLVTVTVTAGGLFTMIFQAGPTLGGRLHDPSISPDAVLEQASATRRRGHFRDCSVGGHYLTVDRRQDRLVEHDLILSRITDEV